MQAPCLFFLPVLRYPVGKVYIVIDVLYPELQYEAVCEHTSGVYRGRHTARALALYAGRLGWAAGVARAWAWAGGASWEVRGLGGIAGG